MGAGENTTFLALLPGPKVLKQCKLPLQITFFLLALYADGITGNLGGVPGHRFSKGKIREG